jgi:hypothetical protein
LARSSTVGVTEAAGLLMADSIRYDAIHCK